MTNLNYCWTGICVFESAMSIHCWCLHNFMISMSLPPDNGDCLASSRCCQLKRGLGEVCRTEKHHQVLNPSQSHHLFISFYGCDMWSPSRSDTFMACQLSGDQWVPSPSPSPHLAESGLRWYHLGALGGSGRGSSWLGILSEFEVHR
jgi:hypothetical protein